MANCGPAAGAQHISAHSGGGHQTCNTTTTNIKHQNRKMSGFGKFDKARGISFFFPLAPFFRIEGVRGVGSWGWEGT